MQIATTAVGVADTDRGAGWLLPAGVLVFVVVGDRVGPVPAGERVWLGGFASRVVGGRATAASTGMCCAWAAVWAAFNQGWWLVALSAVAGGAGYAFSGRRWFRAPEPAPHGPAVAVDYLHRRKGVHVAACGN